MKTTHYLFIDIHTTDPNSRKFTTVSDIESLDILLIDKKKVAQYIDRYTGVDELLGDIDELRE